MRMLLLLIFLVGLAASTPLVGKNECSWGPSYWCSHAKNAKACGAVQHCLDTVWSKQTIAEDPQSTSCSLCKMVVKETRKMLKNKSTEKIVDFFTMACQFMPDENLKKECSFLASDSKMLIKLLESKISDGQLCAAVKQCKGFEDRTHELPPKVPEMPGNTTKICKDCVAFFGDIKQMISDNATVEQIKDMLKNVVCTQLSSSEGLCDFVVDELVPELLQVLGGEVEPQVLCNMLGFCQGTNIYKALVSRIQFRTELKKINKGKIGGTEECDMCKEVMTKVRDMDRDPANQEKVKNFIKTELCEKLGALADQCKTAVDEYGGILFELIASELDPASVCTMLGFCKSASYVAAKPILPGVQMKPKVEIQAKPKAGELCDLCQMAINELDSMITKNSTTQEIEQALAAVCDRLPAQFKDECKDFVKQYAPAILDIIGQELDPLRVCTLLKLCTSESKKLDIKKLEQPLHSTTECVLCEMVMKEVDTMLQGSQVKEEIEVALKSVCNRLSSAELTKECTSFVMQYTEILVDLLVKMPPKEVCTTLGLCTAAKKQAKQELHHVKLISTKKNGLLHLASTASVECVICEYVMSEVDDILKENRSRQAIENALQTVCSKLPSTISKECSDFVNQYADLVIDLLIQEGDPKTVCTELKLCQAGDLKTKQHLASSVGASPECILCEFVMREVDNILQQNRSREAIENALKMVCSKLPSTISQECTDFVNQYADLVINLIIQEGDPKMVCTALKLCSSDLKKALIDSIQFLPIPGQVSGVKLGDEKCEVCEMILNYLDEALKENKTVAAVEALLDQVCNFLPTTFKEECDTLVAQYGPVIAQLISQLMDPKKICEEIKLCASKSQVKQSPIYHLMKKLNSANKDTKLYFKNKQHLLGEKECTFGPSYWCASQENAKKCQAEEHCRTKVWNRN
ncbi:prosaposin-like isoform X2 [Saccostrea cucullata]|uniref:prosaposin-like isoform X2 n=1 Tax=Saccostrea cuccullata TaxID=36930 RepID=UPI002ECFE001